MGNGPGAVPSVARATGVLVALRIAYAYNWFDLGPGLPGVSATFGVGPASWGVALASFLVGAGLLQVPAGLLARRFSARSVSLVGAAVLGGGTLAASVAPTFLALIALRAIAGAGAALFFSPAIGLVGDLQPEGRRGLAVGIFSSAFSLGAALGVFVSALIIPSIGWRGALAVGGILLLALTAIAAATVPRPRIEPVPASESRIPPPLRSRAVWAIGFAFVGLEGASLSAGQYFVPYAQSILGWGPALAGGIASLFVFPSFFGGPIGGPLTERRTNRRTQMIVASAICGALLLVVPFVGLVGIALAAIGFSVSYGAIYAMMYVLARYLPSVGPGDVPLAIGLFNAIQIGGGAVVSLLAAELIAVYGYTPAWIALGVATVAPLGLLALVPPTGLVPEARRAAS